MFLKIFLPFLQLQIFRTKLSILELFQLVFLVLQLLLQLLFFLKSLFFILLLFTSPLFLLLVPLPFLLFQFFPLFPFLLRDYPLLLLFNSFFFPKNLFDFLLFQQLFLPHQEFFFLDAAAFGLLISTFYGFFP